MNGHQKAGSLTDSFGDEEDVEARSSFLLGRCNELAAEIVAFQDLLKDLGRPDAVELRKFRASVTAERDTLRSVGMRESIDSTTDHANLCTRSSIPILRRPTQPTPSSPPISHSTKPCGQEPRAASTSRRSGSALTRSGRAPVPVASSARTPWLSTSLPTIAKRGSRFLP